MKDPRQAKRMMAMAMKDFNALQGMKGDTTFFLDEIFGFHAQQAVEKAIKAYLILNGIKYFKTHDIKFLIQLLNENEIDFPENFNELIIFNAFAVEFRYESLEDNTENLNRDEIIKDIENLF